MLSRGLSVITVIALVFALNVSGALAGFWRTFDGMSDSGVMNPSEFLYGYGTDNNSYGYGFGYGYGNGDFDAGYIVTDVNGNTIATGSAGGTGGSTGSGTTGDTTGGDTSGGTTGGWSNGGTTGGNTGGTTGDSDTTVDEDVDGEVVVIDTDGTAPFCDTGLTFASSYIDTLYNLGIVVGYDGTCEFRPENPITRAEFLKIALRSFGQAYTSEDAVYETFPDVENGTWVANAVGRAMFLGLVDGNDGMFYPNAYITRGEAMKILINTAEIAVDDNIVTSSSFSDVSGWAAKYVEAARDLDIISANELFRPMDSITRAETSKIAVRGIAVVSTINN